MSLADKLDEARKPAPTSIEKIIHTLNDRDRKALEAAATDTTISTAAIFRALQEDGHRIGKDAVSEWRRSCGYSR